MKVLISTLLVITAFSLSGQRTVKMNSLKIHNLSKLIVKASVNGKNGFFLIDTGSSISLINSSQLKRYKLEENPFDHRKAIGVNGSRVLIRKVSNSNVVLGESFSHDNFYSMDLSRISASILAETGIKIVGIIGADLLIKYNGVIDYNQRYLTLAEMNASSTTAISMIK